MQHSQSAGHCVFPLLLPGVDMVAVAFRSDGFSPRSPLGRLLGMSRKPLVHMDSVVRERNRRPFPSAAALLSMGNAESMPSSTVLATTRNHVKTVGMRFDRTRIVTQERHQISQVCGIIEDKNCHVPRKERHPSCGVGEEELPSSTPSEPRTAPAQLGEPQRPTQGTLPSPSHPSPPSVGCPHVLMRSLWR